MRADATKYNPIRIRIRIKEYNPIRATLCARVRPDGLTLSKERVEEVEDARSRAFFIQTFGKGRKVRIMGQWQVYDGSIERGRRCEKTGFILEKQP